MQKTIPDFVITDEIKQEFLNAKDELGIEAYHNALDIVFGKPVLNFAKTLVINLPQPCYANCTYCIDKDLKSHATDTETFFSICEKTVNELKDIKEISLTGGTLPPSDFNRLVDMLISHYPDAIITWNTNGIGIDETYDTEHIRYVNLHRNSANDDENKRLFATNRDIISIAKAKRIFGDKLCLRITVNEHFVLKDYASFGIPLYLNKMLPATETTDKAFATVLSELKMSDKLDIRRRNKYLNAVYNHIPVRVCLGDKLATHIPNRYPTYLNVVIIHRNSTVCGSWFEDDKLLYKPETISISKN